MELRRVNSVLSKVVNLLSESGSMAMTEVIGIGDTVEQGSIRIHRYDGSIEITDLTNAGKRGKKADHFSVYDIDYIKDQDVRNMAAAFEGDLEKVKDYQTALKMAEKLVVDSVRLAKEKGSIWGVKIGKGYSRGIDVMPAGEKPVKINGKHIYVTADKTGFIVRDKEDRNNDPTMIQPIRSAATSAKKFYQWARQNAGRIESMTFREISKEMDANGIDSHYYCAMD